MPEIIAHRGASAAEPEHTRAAYDLAVAQGADYIELDVRAMADGTLALVHDATLARTTGDPRRVDAVRHDELPPRERPLTLDSVLGEYGARARLLVELKDPHPSWERRVIEAIDRHDLREQVVIQSFDAFSLRRLAAVAPGIPYAPLARRRPPVRRLDAYATFASGLGLWHRRVDAKLIDAAHDRGLTVRAWTVNDAPGIERVLAAGADGVITDVPDVARAALAAAPVALSAAA